MLGSRGIWHDGWKAITTHPTLSGWSHFNDDEWELYHIDVDRSEMHNLAAEHPDKVRELVNLWYAEAGANQAFPLDDRVRARDHPHTPPGAHPAAQSLRLLPRHRGGSRVASRQRPQPLVRDRRAGRYPRPGRRRRDLRARVAIRRSRALLRDNRLHYHYSFVGMFEQEVVATEDVPVGENLILSAAFDKDGEDPPGVATGILSLYHGDTKVGEGRIRTQPGKFMLAGEGLCIGRDSGAGVTDELSRVRHRGSSPEGRSSGSRST